MNPTYTDAVFEDSHRFRKYYSTSAPYSQYYIYLYSANWVSEVNELSDVPDVGENHGFTVDGNGNVTIYNAEGLAWLISYVNGLNGEDPHPMNDKTVNIKNDLDMSAHSWVPIGMNGKPFKGELNGGSYVISGIYCDYLGGSNGTGANLGMIGIADGAYIHDLFLKDERLMVRNQTSGSYSMGAIADTLKGGGRI